MFYDSVKADLEKPEDEIFNENIDDKMTVKQAKHANKLHELFKKLNQRLQGVEMSLLMKGQFKQLITAFV